jgi:hexokinase
METMFMLTNAQLLDVAHALAAKIYDGLRKDDQEIRCLPSFIQTHRVPKSGRALVVDFGGTNIRAALVAIQNGKLIIEKGPAKIVIPAINGEVLPLDVFLTIQSDLIASLHPPDDLPLGYCFSYPTHSTLSGDALLIKWTKELFVADTINKPIGSMLVNFLKQYKTPVRCSKVTVINDTIASLFAGLVTDSADAHIGLIVGTGNNMATFLKQETVMKFPHLGGWKSAVPINLESGNFWPPHLIEIDEKLAHDPNYSEIPHEQRFEKAVSGAYLASLMKIAMPDCDVDPEVGSKDVVRLALDGSGTHPRQQQLAQDILKRSAQLVAASLAGVISILNNEQPRRLVNIAAEGSLFWGYDQYEPIAKTTLRELLNAQQYQSTDFQFKTSEHANLLGSAIAALANGD